MFIPKPFLFEILFNCNLLAQPFAQVDLTVTSFPYRLDYLYLLFRYQKCQLYSFFCHVSLNFTFHVLILMSLPLFYFSLFSILLLFLSDLFLFIFLTVRRRFRWWTVPFDIRLFSWLFLINCFYLFFILLLNLSLLYFLNYIKCKLFVSQFADGIT